MLPEMNVELASTLLVMAQQVRDIVNLIPLLDKYPDDPLAQDVSNLIKKFVQDISDAAWKDMTTDLFDSE